jgi:nickel-dependent lactate racemase
MELQLHSGSIQETVTIPDEHLMGILDAPRFPGHHSDTRTLVTHGLNHPVDSSSLESLLTAESRITIIVDDNSRPTPTASLLPPVIEKLSSLGIKDPQISLIIGKGLHRSPTRAERVAIFGEEIMDRLHIDENNAEDPHAFSFLGSTSNGTPVHINKKVVESDLVITIGVIKAHSFAGFTGGAKSILPAVSAKETILHNHSYQFLSYSDESVGEPDKSFTRRDMEEAAGLLPVPLVIVNTVLDENKQPFAVLCGNYISAHRRGVALFKKHASVELKQPADMVIIEGKYPSSENLYFALSNMATVAGTRNPVVKEGGTIILVAECRDGIGADVVETMFADAGTPFDVLNELRAHPTRPGQWAAQHLSTYLTKRKIGIVSRGLSMEQIQKLHMIPFDTVQQAIESGLEEYGTGARILVARSGDMLIANSALEKHGSLA